MRIFALYPYVPYPTNHGTYQRTYHLLRGLAQEHSVDLVCLAEDPERRGTIAHFREFCSEVEFVPFEHPSWPRLIPGRLLHPLPTTVRHWRSGAAQAAIDRFLDGKRYDVAHVCDIVLLPYLWRQSELRVSVDRNRVDYHFQTMVMNVRKPRGRERLLALENLWKLRWYEKRAARGVSLEIVCGSEDEAFIRSQISERVPVAVIENGVDLDYLQPELVPSTRAPTPTLLFCAALGYVANLDALEWFFAEIFEPLRRRNPDFEMLIVGNDPSPAVWAYASRPGVRVVGEVPDVRPYYRRSWLQVVPLRIGSGTRLKILESLALGTPVVSTSIGAQSLGLVHGEEILIADSAQAFVDQIDRALREPALRARLEAAGLATARRRFSWAHSSQRLCRIYEGMFDSRTRPEQSRRLHSPG